MGLDLEYDDPAQTLSTKSTHEELYVAFRSERTCLLLASLTTVDETALHASYLNAFDHMQPQGPSAEQWMVALRQSCEQGHTKTCHIRSWALFQALPQVTFCNLWVTSFAVWRRRVTPTPAWQDAAPAAGWVTNCTGGPSTAYKGKPELPPLRQGSFYGQGSLSNTCKMKTSTQGLSHTCISCKTHVAW